MKLVAHLPLSNSNYPIALKSLRDRYDNPRVIINSHVDVILKLKAIEKESAAELRKLLSSLDENLMAISALRTDMTKSDFLVKILAEKLDRVQRTMGARASRYSASNPGSTSGFYNYSRSSFGICTVRSSRSNYFKQRPRRQTVQAIISSVLKRFSQTRNLSTVLRATPVFPLCYV